MKWFRENVGTEAQMKWLRENLVTVSILVIVAAIAASILFW